ncbi:TetR family transcriptional regulator [Denitromonas iodatirespirans]
MPHNASPASSSNADAEALILRLARELPMLGQAAVAERLRSEGVRISPSGVRYIWQRHGLETAVKRLEALVANGQTDLPPEQQRLLDRNKRSARLSATAPRADADPSAPPADAGQGEPLSRQELVLHVAAELFTEQGYDRTSIRDIAHRAGLLPGSVYHHFPSKEDLYLAIYREGFRRILARVTAAAAGGTDPWDNLRLACEEHVSGMVEGPYVERLTGHGLALIGEQRLFDRIREDRKAYEQIFKRLIEALPLTGQTNPTLLRLTLLGAMNWVAIWYREGKQTPRDIAHAMVDMLRQGVASGHALPD